MGSAKNWGIGILIGTMLIAAYVAVTSFAALNAPLTAEHVASFRDVDRAQYRLLDLCVIQYDSYTHSINGGTFGQCYSTMLQIQRDCAGEYSAYLEYIPSCRDYRLALVDQARYDRELAREQAIVAARGY